MLLIISNEQDTSTNHVIDWLIHYGVPFIRINGEDQFILQSFELSDCSFECKLVNVKNNQILDIKRVSAIWYRRGDVSLCESGVHHHDYLGIVSFIRQEYRVLHDFILNYFEGLPRLDSYYRRSVNKLTVLSVAKSLGLMIPSTYLFEGMFPDSLHGSFITKAAHEVFNYLAPEGYYSSPTALFDYSLLKELDRTYSLSKIQMHIEKECDVRVFYLCGVLYAMAIMSQSNEQSRVDFRHYPNDPPNRCLALKLPGDVSDKLVSLMRKLSLDSGSIDLVLNTDGLFVFLEVNPVGQFGMTSGPCNYHLEREIARELRDMSSK